MSSYIEAVKISAKSREEVRKFIANASETRKEESKQAEDSLKLAKSFGFDAEQLAKYEEAKYGKTTAKSVALIAARQAFRYARAHLREALLTALYPDVSDTDNRTVDEMLSASRAICELTEKLNVNVK